MSAILQGLLDQVLGPGLNGTHGNRKYVCCFHVSNPPGKKKLEIQLKTDEKGYNPWACWVCGAKGKTIRSLFRKMGAKQTYLDKLGTIIVKGPGADAATNFDGLLPEEYVFLPETHTNDILGKHAKVYLKQRGVTEDDIYKYQIGYCDDGEYAERIIIPSYDDKGELNFFVGRTFDPNGFPKYKLPEVSRDIIFNELFINWNAPIILVEGSFDMIAVKRNCIPLLGKSITQNLMKKLITSKVRKIYVALDDDALKAALKHCETFISYGKRVYLVDMLVGKDPAELGFKNFTKIVQKATPLTLSKIMKLKLQLI